MKTTLLLWALSDVLQQTMWFVQENWSLLLIPLIAAFVGWSTNVLALRMTFYPVEFYGFTIRSISPIGWKLPVIGWQGIIPSKAEVMAERAVELITSKLIDIETQFAQIDPKVVAREMEPVLERLTRETIDEAMSEHAPLVWKLLSQKRKASIYAQAAKEFPHITEELMLDIKQNISELFDVKQMAVEALTSDRALLNRIFLEVGHKEFKFIEKSGFVFGFAFGLIQMVIWYFYQAWWQLPIGGLCIGYLTNILALRLIFEPRSPITVFGVKVQGLFIKRQQEVSAAYARIVSENILTMPKIFDTILYGKASDKLVEITERHVREGVDKTAGFSSSLIKFTSGTKAYDAIKNIACKRFIEELPSHIQLIFGYAEQALDLEHTLRERMQALVPEEFERFLRPVFQEDESKLILVGALLGGLAGAIQALLMWLL